VGKAGSAPVAAGRPPGSRRATARRLPVATAGPGPAAGRRQVRACPRRHPLA